MIDKSSGKDFIKEWKSGQIQALTDSVLHCFSYDKNTKMILLQSFPCFSNDIHTKLNNKIKEKALSKEKISPVKLNHSSAAYNKLVNNITTMIISNDFFPNNNDIEEISNGNEHKHYLAKTKDDFDEFVRTQEEIQNNLKRCKSNNKDIDAKLTQNKLENKFYFVENKKTPDENECLISFTNDNCDNKETVIDQYKIFKIPLYTKTPTITFNVKSGINQENQQTVIDKINKWIKKKTYHNIPMFKTTDISNEVENLISHNTSPITLNLEYTKEYLEYCLSYANQGKSTPLDQIYYPFYYKNNLPKSQQYSFAHVWLHKYALVGQKVYEELGIGSERNKEAKMEIEISIEPINIQKEGKEEEKEESSIIPKENEEEEKEESSIIPKENEEEEKEESSIIPEENEEEENESKNSKNNEEDNKKEEQNINNEEESKKSAIIPKENEEENESKNSKNNDGNNNNNKNNEENSKKEEDNKKEEKKDKEKEDSYSVVLSDLGNEEENKSENSKEEENEGTNIRLSLLKTIKDKYNLGDNFEIAIIDDKQSDLIRNRKKLKLKDSSNPIEAHVGHIIENVGQGKRKRQVLYVQYTNSNGKPLKFIINLDKRIPKTDKNRGNKNNVNKKQGINWMTIGNLKKNNKDLFEEKGTEIKMSTVERDRKGRKIKINVRSSLERIKKEKSQINNQIIRRHININKKETDIEKKHGNSQKPWGWSKHLNTAMAKEIYRDNVFLNGQTTEEDFKTYNIIREKPEEQNNKNKMNKQPFWGYVNGQGIKGGFGYKVDGTGGLELDQKNIPQTRIRNKDKKNPQVYGTPSHIDMFNEKNRQRLKGQLEFWDRHSKNSEKVGKYGNNILHTITSSNNANKQFNKGYTNLVKQTKYNIRFDPQQYKSIYGSNQNLMKQQAEAYMKEVAKNNKGFKTNVNNNNLQIQNYSNNRFNTRTDNFLRSENDIDMFMHHVNKAKYKENLAWMNYGKKGLNNYLRLKSQGKYVNPNTAFDWWSNK